MMGKLLPAWNKEADGWYGGRQRNLQTIVDGAWTDGEIMEAVGRLLFTMGGTAYLCAITAVTASLYIYNVMDGLPLFRHGGHGW